MFLNPTPELREGPEVYILCVSRENLYAHLNLRACCTGTQSSDGGYGVKWPEILSDYFGSFGSSVAWGNYFTSNTNVPSLAIWG